MTASGRVVLALFTVCLFSDSAVAFGTKRTHQDLAGRSVDRADAMGRVSSYLREDLGLPNGVTEPLAIQFGLDGLIDQDLKVDDDPDTPEIDTRLNRSLSRRDEDENGNDARFPYAPLDLKVFSSAIAATTQTSRLASAI